MYVSRSRHSCGGRGVVFAKVHRTIIVHVKEFTATIENALRFGIDSYSGLHTCRLVSGCVVLLEEVAGMYMYLVSKSLS